jgi:hypothetical protein
MALTGHCDRPQVNDGPVTTYEAGQSFSEMPGERHGVSANASETEPPKLLAVFVVDTNETELTIQSRTGRHNDLAMVSYDQSEYEPFRAVAAPARLLELISPAGFEKYFAELADLLRSGGGVDQITNLAERYGMELRMGVPELCAKFKLKLVGE